MLHDISHRRQSHHSPQPNSHDVLDPSAMTAKGTNSVNYTSAASEITSLTGGFNGQATIVGAIDITTSIMTASGPGAGKFGTTTVTAATQPHGLTFIPGVIPYYGSSTTLFGVMPSENYSATSSAQGLWYDIGVSADAVNVYVKFRIMQFGRTGTLTLPPLNLKVYLLQQTAN